MMHCGLKGLHGFLGQASDWHSVPLECEAIDLWKDLSGIPKGAPFRIWAQLFNERMRREYTVSEKPVLMGYSMGGRLSMSAALSDPSVYRALVLVSANPGSSEGRVARTASDEKWAERFTNDKWSEVLHDWNHQPVLQSKHGVQLPRAEESFQRPLLARALREWSLAEQPDFREALADLRLPVLYVTGREDSKFTTLMQAQKLGEGHELVTIANAGHRVPWDQPEIFAKTVREFLANV